MDSTLHCAKKELVLKRKIGGQEVFQEEGLVGKKVFPVQLIVLSCIKIQA
jgi:hypothetical protein